MQGTAADIIKRAMISVADWLDKNATRTRLIMQVHDELVFEVPSDEADGVVPRLIDCMSGAADLAVPLRVDGGVGENWEEAH